MGRICDCENERSEIFLYLGGDIKREGEFPDGDYPVHYYYCYNCGKEFMVGGRDRRTFQLNRDSSNVIDITRLSGVKGINFLSLGEKNIRNLIVQIMAEKNQDPYFTNGDLVSTVNEFVLQRKL